MRQIARSPIWLFLLLTIAATWPLAAHLTRSLASDYGDPLFTTWAMGWVSSHLTSGLWDANIFYPERNTLAFSDHMIGEAVQTLPIYWATHNELLCYNAALILSFTLCGYGTYLLVRDLSGSAAGGLAAGVFFAFNEYRLSYEISHLQSLSIHWLPFALLGLHRYVMRGSRAALAFGAAALVLLNLSAGFHMLYAAPFVAAFVLFDVVRQGRARDARAWRDFAIAASAVAIATLPVAWHYVLLQRQFGFERPLEEVVRFSATLDQYRSALPGFSVPLAFALLACALAAPRTASRRALVFAASLAALLTFWLSLGPVVQGGGRPLPIPGLYALLYDFAPGFRGLRAVARYAMYFFFFLAILAGFGVAALEARSSRVARALAFCGCAIFLWQTRPSPFPLDREWPFVSAGLAPVPAYLRPDPTPPAIYRFAAGLDTRAVLAEFPFGDNAYDLRYMFFSAVHHHPMLGGFSGVFPASWVRRRDALEHPLASPDAAWRALDGATHAIVHTRGWPDNTGAQIIEWLRAHGASDAGAFDDAHVMVLKP